jgi:hypothetical protein
LKVKFQRKPVVIAMLTALSLSNAGPALAATDTQELLELKNTIVNLVDALVTQGVISKEQAETLKRDAAAKARIDAATPAQVVEEAAPVDAPGTQVVRVPYVPEFVKDEIRAQVREELRADVANDVIAKAKEERWGVKDALPAWVTAMTWYGDFRLRDQFDGYASGNLPGTYPNFMAINDAGGITRAGADTFLNSTEDRNRLRWRLRFGFESVIADDLKFDLRLASGNEINPVSLNQTLGNSGQMNDIFIDRVYLQWKARDYKNLDWLTVSAGRINKPFLASEMTWDDDLAFEGVAANLRQSIATLADMVGADIDLPKTHIGTNFGAFPIFEEELPLVDGSSNDKWLWGAQLVFDHAFEDESLLKLGVSYYDFVNIFGQRNAFGSTLKDWTAPEFMQKGNTVYDIRNDNDLTTELFGLAADFTYLSLTARFDYAGFGATHVILTGDILKNIGYDEDAIERRTGARIDERSLGYYIDLRIGRPVVAKRGEWAVFTNYRYLQRDAVVDAFTDSNFHLGGTDTKGYVIGGELGVTKDTWLRVRWLSADEIDGAPLGIDTLQADLNARF